MFSVNKDRLIKFVLVILFIYLGLFLFDFINNTNDSKIMEKTILLTVLVTFLNFIYPTL